jgi:predicted RNA-binding Zn ribbon-like protein
MAVSWTKHRFSGGLLALDTTNTVVLRGDPNSFDRFEDKAEIARFAGAASGFRSAELGGRQLVFHATDAAARRVAELREAADQLFREAAATGELQTALLPGFLRASAACLDDSAERVGAEGMLPGAPSSGPLNFETALAVSALSLLSGDACNKVRICRNCRWLFLDRSRNASRLWCDMSVCGNRHKAKRHYERRRQAEKEAEVA